MPHAALWVVQPLRGLMFQTNHSFQCRTRLCGWCSLGMNIITGEVVDVSMPHAALWVVQQVKQHFLKDALMVSMPHAALWVVQLRRSQPLSP